MRLVIFIEPQQGAGHDDQRRVAQLAEETGFEGFFRSDHYVAMGVDGRPGPTDSWVTLGALAVQTSRIRLGTLVTSATFRLPGPLAISVAQVDAMSQGRVELGLGAGWFEREHSAYGIPFPPVAERFDRFEEQLEIISGLWTADGPYSFAGKHYQLVDSPALPMPVQSPRPPIIVGGRGRKRTPALAVRYADEFNSPFVGPAEATELFARVRAASDAAGRATPLTLSSALVLCCGRDDAEVARRASVIGRSVPEMRESGHVLIGTPDQVVEQISAFAEAGATRIYLQVLDLADLHHIELVATAVAPQLA